MAGFQQKGAFVEHRCLLSCVKLVQDAGRFLKRIFEHLLFENNNKLDENRDCTRKVIVMPFKSCCFDQFLVISLGGKMIDWSCVLKLTRKNNTCLSSHD